MKGLPTSWVFGLCQRGTALTGTAPGLPASSHSPLPGTGAHVFTKAISRFTLGALLLAVLAPTTQAATFDFAVPSGAWEDPENWAQEALPGPSDFARVSDHRNALITSAQTVGAFSVSNIGNLEIGSGGSLTAAHAIVFGSLVGNRSLLLSGGSLSVQGTSPGIMSVYGRMDAIAGSSIDARRVELESSDLDFRFDASSLTVDHLFVDALTALNLPAGKLQITDSTVTTRESELYYGVVNLTGSTWTSTGTMALGRAPLTLSSNASLDLNALRFVGLSFITININSGSRLRINSLSTPALEGGVINLDDGTLASGGNFINYLPVNVAGTSTIDSGPGAITQMAPLSGSTLTKSGSGFLNLGADTNLLSNILIQQGTLQIGSGAVLTPDAMLLGPEEGEHGVFRLSTGGTLRMSGLNSLAVGGGTGELQMNGGILEVTGPFSTAVPISLSADSTVHVVNTTAALHGTISGAGQFRKTGTGTLVLHAANPYTGGTTLHDGTLEFGTGSLGTGLVRQLGGTLRWAAGNTEDISSRLEFGGTGGTFDIQGNTVTLSHSLSGPGSLQTIGTGSLTLSGPSVDLGGNLVADVLELFTSGNIAVGGSLEVGSTTTAIWTANGGNISTGSSATFGVLAGSSGVGILNGASLTVGTDLYVGYLGSAALVANTGSTVSADNLILGAHTGPGTFTLNSGASLLIGGADAIRRGAGAGYFELFGGTLKVTGESLTTSIPMELRNVSTVDTGGFEAELAGTLDGSGRLLKTGEGTLALSGNNSFSGGTVVLAGTVAAKNDKAFGTGDIEVAGGTLLIREGYHVDNAILLTGGALAHELAAGSQFDQLNAYVGALPGQTPTQARLLGGEASAAATLVGSFEATSLALNDSVRMGSVFKFTGVPILGGPGGETDIFVLELALPSIPADDDWFLGWRNPETNLWVNAVEGNWGGIERFVLGSYNPDTDFQLGTYGVDLDNGQVWAVLNHNSDFAVIPEPSIGLLLLASLVLLLFRRRNVHG